MRKARVSLVVFCGVALAWDITVGTLCAIRCEWLLLSINAASAAVMIFLLIRNVKGYRNGLGQAREDHRSGSAVDTGASAADKPSASTRTGSGVGVPRETSPEPITAWKAARIMVDPSGRGVQLGALNEGVRHPIEGEAYCRSLRQLSFLLETKPCHYDAPHLDCSCGFYAWKTRADAVEMIGSAGWALLEVELFGTVIQHERGYRAQKQRVLGVTVNSRCNGFMCHTAARWIDFAESAKRGRADFTVWCDEHKPSGAKYVTTIQEVANYLRCEVRWAEL